MKATNFLLFFCSVLLLNNTYAKEIINHSELRDQVKQFLQSKLYQQLPTSDHKGVKVHVRSIDQRLRLSKCDKALTLKLQGQTVKRNNSVKVSCQSITPWSMYVGSTVALEKPVIVSRHELPRHHILEKSDLTVVQQDIYSLRGGYSTQFDDVIGQQLKRPLRSGNIVYNYQLQAPDIIKKGDRVTVIAKRGSLSVMSHGIALGNASAGENVRIENQKSSRIIQARVIAPGTVEVI